MELGEIQKAWIKSLRENGHRQTSNILGIVGDNGEYKACCLGEGLCVLNTTKGIDLPFFEGRIVDVAGSRKALWESYNELGLFGEIGQLGKSFFKNNEEYTSLSTMNDFGFTWAEIAEYIEQNPENVFNKSV